MGKQQFSNEEIREAIKELLSVQKVDLSLVDDIAKQLTKLSVIRKKIQEATKE